MRILSILLLVLASGAAAAQAPRARPAEYLATMPLGDLVPRTRERGGTWERDWLPPGVSFDHALRIVTVRRISGATDDGAPLRFIQGLATCFTPCPDQRLDPIDRAPFQGRPAARVTLDMPASAISGLPSRAYVLAVAGERALHVAVVLFRGPRSPADERFAQDVLRSVVLCTPASRVAACGSD
jgi:hypothetical protein